tara:strand:- start:40 stop:171 length:132 start_codon:yes stop_codon:yes gene_type:complete
MIELNDVKLPRLYAEVNLSIAKVEVMTQEPALHSKERGLSSKV